MTGYVNRKKKKTLGKVVTEEVVKFQDSFKMKMLATGYAFMYLVYPNDLTTPDLKRPPVKATVNTFKKAISFKNDLFSDGSSGDPDVILDPF